jgi:hypothetical protein
MFGKCEREKRTSDVFPHQLGCLFAISAQKTMIIVLDSNIWLGELGLNSSLGAATRFFIRHNNARIALPEVVRFEVEENFRTRLREFTKDIGKNYRQLLAAFGALPLNKVTLRLTDRGRLKPLTPVTPD